MTTISLTRETDDSKLALTIKEIKDEDKNLPVLQLAEKYGVSMHSKAKQGTGFFIIKNKLTGEEAKKMVESILSPSNYSNS